MLAVPKSIAISCWKKLIKPTLQGDWQVQNTAAALNVVGRLGYALSPEQINHAMKNISISGRLETISEEPLVIADVAHNAQSAKALAQWLKNNPVKGQTRAVFSVLKDKNVAQWLSEFEGLIDHWFVFELSGARALPLNEMKLTLADHVGMFSCFGSAKETYQMAYMVTEADDRVIVFGSFHVLDAVFSKI